MPTLKPSELCAFEPVSDEMILAALDRAQRHNPQGYDVGVLRSLLFEHLGFVYTSTTTLKLRPQIARLTTRGLVDRRKTRGYDLWRLTSDGAKQLAIARRKGTDLELPESPQHRAWRHAQTDAGKTIDRVRKELRITLAETSALVDSQPDRKRDAYLTLRTRLASQLQNFATMLYCLNEWPEPDDKQPDLHSSSLWERRKRAIEHQVTR